MDDGLGLVDRRASEDRKATDVEQRHAAEPLVVLDNTQVLLIRQGAGMKVPVGQLNRLRLARGPRGMQKDKRSAGINASFTFPGYMPVNVKLAERIDHHGRVDPLEQRIAFPRR